MGFELCEGCYNSSSTLPGSFSQLHTPAEPALGIGPGPKLRLGLGPRETQGRHYTPEHKLEIVPLDLEHELEFVHPFNLADIVFRFGLVESEVDGSDAPEDMNVFLHMIPRMVQLPLIRRWYFRRSRRYPLHSTI
ncbi:proteolysis 1 [Actinidia rufa]|uniref:Proteolysis 1 n=1 Tax=Actinidia rufa TaxID=165716 RepID=A0A7J0E7M8_9ERIC|nr:proteolysis 1 [Actinidia rufa]